MPKLPTSAISLAVAGALTAVIYKYRTPRKATDFESSTVQAYALDPAPRLAGIYEQTGSAIPTDALDGVGTGVILFKATSPDRGVGIRRLP